MDECGESATVRGRGCGREASATGGECGAFATVRGRGRGVSVAVVVERGASATVGGRGASATLGGSREIALVGGRGPAASVRGSVSSTAEDRKWGPPLPLSKRTRGAISRTSTAEPVASLANI